MEKNDFSDNSILLESKIRELNTELESASNPEEIEKLSSLIKKNVPFFRRKYFAAFLLQELLKKDSNKRNVQTKDRKDFKPTGKKPENPAAKAPQAQKEQKKKEFEVPEGAKTLYLNIGKMRRLYGKDLSILLQKELGITREDIYVLRVHDKYTFITMSEENCNKAIEKLNGKEINGRIAELNFSNRS